MSDFMGYGLDAIALDNELKKQVGDCPCIAEMSTLCPDSKARGSDRISLRDLVQSNPNRPFSCASSQPAPVVADD